MEGKNSHFFVSECGELIFTKKDVGRIFDLRKNGRNGTVTIGFFLPFSSYCSPILPVS